ncbi:MAG: GNAT family N-acetyltransferase [Chloroflexota bacterium]|nr:GNAT family N-acetyltransferase [Chloroflexota bacterium]
MQIFLETERLVLRRFTPEDVDNLFDLDSDPAVLRFVGGTPPSRAMIQTADLPWYLSYYERFAGYGFWAAIQKSSGQFLGWFLFRPPEGSSPTEVELGYRLVQTAWGQGYSTEGSRALIRKGFTELDVQRVVAFALAANHASRRVLEKSGLTLVRAFRHTWPDRFDGATQDLVEYALPQADWAQQQAAHRPGLPCQSSPLAGASGDTHR